ncbi:MAG: transglutaminase domain-containing protein [Planctomycetes bacterium]|nr:transglutaminase domain-containing protein [Planctomycetota bacterium]
MNQRQTIERWRAVRTLLLFACVAAGGACAVSYRLDQRQLSALTQAIVAGASSPIDRVLALQRWVHDRPGTSRNLGCFLVPALGPTPLQVMQGGGDCADKARLLCSVLHEAGISATPAMCYDEATGRPTHTIVEARIGPGRYMVVDPAFDLWFPRADGITPYDLLDLRRSPDIVPQRIADLRRANPTLTDADEYYLRSPAAYHTASTFHWDKNRWTRWLRDGLQVWFGEEVYRIRRPLAWEQPKVALSALCLAPALLWVIVRLIRGTGRRLIVAIRSGAVSRRPVPATGVAAG